MAARRWPLITVGSLLVLAMLFVWLFVLCRKPIYTRDYYGCTICGASMTRTAYLLVPLRVEIKPGGVIRGKHYGPAAPHRHCWQFLGGYHQWLHGAVYIN